MPVERMAIWSSPAAGCSMVLTSCEGDEVVVVVSRCEMMMMMMMMTGIWHAALALCSPGLLAGKGPKKQVRRRRSRGEGSQLQRDLRLMYMRDASSPIAGLGGHVGRTP